MFRPKILNIRHLRRFFILALMASNDEFFGAHRVTNFESEYDILVLTSDFLHMCVCYSYPNSQLHLGGEK